MSQLICQQLQVYIYNHILVYKHTVDRLSARILGKSVNTYRQFNTRPLRLSCLWYYWNFLSSFTCYLSFNLWGQVSVSSALIHQHTSTSRLVCHLRGKVILKNVNRFCSRLLHAASFTDLLEQLPFTFTFITTHPNLFTHFLLSCPI